MYEIDNLLSLGSWKQSRLTQWRRLIWQWNARCDDVFSINRSIILLIDYNRLQPINRSSPNYNTTCLLMLLH